MQIKFSEQEAMDIIEKYARDLLYAYKLENKVFEVSDHYGDFTVTIKKKPKEQF